MLSLAAMLIVAMAAALSSCSTTRRLPKGETLYTGVKKMEISAPDGAKVPGGVADKVKTAVDVKPNQFKVMGFPVPIPVGLWVYNNWNPDSHGLKGWMYRKLVQEPVTVSDVRPNLRTTMIESVLDNSGYFRGTASYELIDRKSVV